MSKPYNFNKASIKNRIVVTMNDKKIKKTRKVNILSNEYLDSISQVFNQLFNNYGDQIFIYAEGDDYKKCKSGIFLYDLSQLVNIFGSLITIDSYYNLNFKLSEMSISEVYNTIYEECRTNLGNTVDFNKKEITKVDKLLFNNLKCPTSYSGILNSIFLLRSFPIFNIFVKKYKTAEGNYDDTLDFTLDNTGVSNTVFLNGLYCESVDYYINNIVNIMLSDTNLLNYNIVDKRDPLYYENVLDIMKNANGNEYNTQDMRVFFILRELKYKYKIYNGNIDFSSEILDINNPTQIDPIILEKSRLLIDKIVKKEIPLTLEDMDIYFNRGAIRLIMNCYDFTFEFIKYTQGHIPKYTITQSIAELHNARLTYTDVPIDNPNINIYTMNVLRKDAYNNYIRSRMLGPHPLTTINDFNALIDNVSTFYNKLNNTVTFLNQFKKYITDDDLVYFLFFSFSNCTVIYKDQNKQLSDLVNIMNNNVDCDINVEIHNI